MKSLCVEQSDHEHRMNLNTMELEVLAEEGDTDSATQCSVYSRTGSPKLDNRFDFC